MNMNTADPLIGDLWKSLSKNDSVDFVFDAQGKLKVQPLSVYGRLWHLFDPQYHDIRLSRLAALVSAKLADLPCLPISEAANDINIKVARKLIKEAIYYDVVSEPINALKKQTTAAKLGLRVSTLDNNPGLQAFAEMHHLERYLLHHGHTLNVDPATGDVLILKEGKWCRWHDAYAEIVQWPPLVKRLSFAWIYGDTGLQHKDMYDWSELKPYMHGNPAEWNYQHIFEFCSCVNPNSIKNGCHSWLRLKTPSGDIYSVGLYRPEKEDWTQNFKLPFRIKPGNLSQPDVSEYWDYDIFTIEVAITEDDFNKMKATIEEDKKNEDLTFQLFNGNCMLYCKKVASIANIGLPSSENILKFIISEPIQYRVGEVEKHLPDVVRKVCRVGIAFFLNITQACLGACFIDADLNEKQRQHAIPHLRTIWDFFDFDKLYLHHPNILWWKLSPQVWEWRQSEIARIQATEYDPELRESKINAIRFGLPPHFAVTLK